MPKIPYYPLPHFLLILSLVPILEANTILFSHQYQPTAFYQCLKQNNQDKIILELVSDIAGISELSVQNIINAKNAGLGVEVFVTPCRKRSVEKELAAIGRSLGVGVVERYWVAPGVADSECSWTQYSYSQNCDYIQYFRSKMKLQYQTPTQISTNKQSWSQCFGSVRGCQDSSNSLLWWIPIDPKQADNQPNFNSYRQVGGWATPYMKILNSKIICGSEVYQSYYV